MSSSEKDKIQAADRICRKLHISVDKLFEKIDNYNKRVEEINRETVDYAKKFILPKAVKVGDHYEYTLNNDDKAILTGFKEKGQNALKEEFPEFEEIWEDLMLFQDSVDPNDYM